MVVEIEKTWPQILAIVIGCLSSLSNGLLFSWASPFLPKITKDKENYDITEDEASYFNTIHPVTMIVSCMIFSTLSDNIGRKKTLLLIAVPQLLAWIFAAIARSVYVFYASRICSGISDSILFTVFPVYIGEIASPKIRGTWGNGQVVSMMLGLLLINVIGSYFSVKETSYICMPLSIIFFIFFSQMPESPYFYIMKERDEHAKDALRFLKRKQDVEEDLMLLKKDVMRQLSESGTWKDLFMIESNRRALISGVFLRVSQQLSGTTVFLMYTQFFFEKSGGNISSEMSSIIYSGTTFVLVTLVVTFVMHRLGRRICYVISTLPYSLVQFSLSIYFYLDQYYPSIDVTFLNWMPITGMVSCLFFASYGISIIPTLMLGELYSASIKSKAMTVLMITYGTMIVVSNNVFYILNSYLGLFAPLLFFGSCTAVSALLAYSLIPETQGKTLEEIQQSLKKS